MSEPRSTWPPGAQPMEPEVFFARLLVRVKQLVSSLADAPAPYNARYNARVANACAAALVSGHALVRRQRSLRTGEAKMPPVWREEYLPYLGLSWADVDAALADLLHAAETNTRIQEVVGIDGMGGTRPDLLRSLYLLDGGS